MEEWKNGRTEERKNGRMEELKNGRMEEGPSSTLPFFHPSISMSRLPFFQPSISMSRLYSRFHRYSLSDRGGDSRNRASSGLKRVRGLLSLEMGKPFGSDRGEGHVSNSANRDIECVACGIVADERMRPLLQARAVRETAGGVLPAGGRSVLAARDARTASGGRGDASAGRDRPHAGVQQPRAQTRRDCARTSRERPRPGLLLQRPLTDET
jgi:hypothetical protein